MWSELDCNFALISFDLYHILKHVNNKLTFLHQLKKIPTINEDTIIL